MSKFLLNYLKIINEASNTGLSPAPLIEKIFSDIKKQDFNKSFVLVYSNEDVFKFLPNKIKQQIQQQIFCSQIKYLIILNSKIYNNVDQLKIYQQKIDTLIQKINNKEKLNINKQELYNEYLTFIQSIVDQKHIQQIKSLPNVISDYIFNNFIYNFIPKLKIDKRLSILNICNFIKNDIESIINRIKNTLGLSVNQIFSDCSLIFINSKVFQNNNLEKIYNILNHQLDHHFYFRISAKTGSHNLDKKTADDNIKYIFDKSQIWSRVTDLCNLFNHKVLPIEHENSLKIFLQFFENNCRKYNNLQSCISQNLNSYKWLNNISKDDYDTIQISCMYFIVKNTKEYLINRITKEFDIYIKKYNNAKYKFKYSQSLKRKFKLK